MTTGNWNSTRPLLALLLLGVVSCGRETPEDVSIDAQAAIVGQTYTLSCLPPGTGFGEVLIPPVPGTLPFVPLESLKIVPNPAFDIDLKTGAFVTRGDLEWYVLDLKSAIQLGKALFWDVQAGSDDAVACATCHFQGGADVRAMNQLHPGFNGVFDAHAVNYPLAAGDFPFTTPIQDIDNIAGSQGVRRALYQGLGAGGTELLTYVSDPVFGNARQVTGIHTPPAVNAIFNHRQFGNARAQPEFNGVNPFGTRDPGAHVWQVIDTRGNVGAIDIRISNAALASQAVGPPLNPVEMSAAGRTFPDLGRKMLLRKPLRLQKVDPRDSVLGQLAETRVKGLKTTYAALIQKAFQPRWWDSRATVTIEGKPYTLMEANFSMYWGLSLMLYQATLVADSSPMDQYVASRVFDLAAGTGTLLGDNPALLDPVVNRLAAEGITAPLAAGGSRPITRADILAGLDLFEKALPLPGTVGLPPGTGVGCNFCHVGAETTSASIRALAGHGLEPGDVALRNLGFDLRMERMFMGVRTPPPVPPAPYPPVPVGADVVTFDSRTYAVNAISIFQTPVDPIPVKIAVYDAGWYNIGVRPTAEDLGVGGLDPFGKPLSWVEFYQWLLADPSMIRVVGGGLGCVDASGLPVTPPAAPVGSPYAGEVLNPATGVPLLAGGLLKAEATDVAGSFKTSGLRNVELTGPYFHSGAMSTLRQAVEFYDDGGFFQNETLSPLVRPLGLTEDQVIGLVAFLIALTDERVLYQRAPFDHPELAIPVGQGAAGNDLLTVLPQVGATGAAAPLPRFLGLNPFQP